MIERAKSSVNTKVTGLVAFGVLLYGAMSLMIVIESTFNLIYGPPNRGAGRAGSCCTGAC